MKFSHVVLAALCAVSFAVPACAQEAAPKSLLDVGDEALKRLTPSSAQVKFARDGAALVVTITPGNEGYPGIALKPEGAAWDLSAFGHVEARVVNLGTKPISLSLRVDNAGNWQDNPWNTESVFLKPGEAGKVETIFGYAYGKKPNYKLNPAAVSNLLIFAGKSDVEQKFRIETLQAAGPAGEKPPVDPNSIRHLPPNGVLMGAGAANVPLQVSAKNAQSFFNSDNGKQSFRVVFPVAKGEQNASIKPATGRWDLRDYLEVRVKLRNDGQAPVAPRLRVESNGGPTDWATATLAPNATGEVVVPFISATTFDFAKKETGNRVTSDSVAGLTIAADNDAAERSLAIESITAALPTLKIPAWLGKQPPVAGDWVQTLNENFDGDKIDDSIWNVYGPNYWDKKTRWSKDNAILGGGVLKLRYEKKRGRHNDDPKGAEQDYTAGFLESYGKWRQRYGYFEARMKLPKAPGLWPAFWMMPDRGPEAGEQWRRQDTGNGGMELDVMEHLTRWGPNRYNVALHYDGYGKEHKSVGTDKIYFQPDKDGFITAGLLWTPGSAIFYANGHEVARWETDRISNVASDLMFTLPQGGWDNNAVDHEKLPADFVIDYVRVWQRKDLASAVDGKIAK